MKDFISISNVAMTQSTLSPSNTTYLIDYICFQSYSSYFDAYYRYSHIDDLCQRDLPAGIRQFFAP